MTMNRDAARARARRRRTPEEETDEEETDEEETDEEDTDVPRDWRALIVACSGLGVIAVVAVMGFILVPGSVSSDEVSTKGENIVAIAAAAFTAVATALAAYFGIKAANLAREETTKAAKKTEATAEKRSKAAERQGIRTAHLAGASPEQLREANREATEQIKALGLEEPARRRKRR